MWSPCQCDIRILSTFARDIPQMRICRCVPSAQSNRMPSPLNSKYMALGFLSFVGIMQDVPKNVSCMGGFAVVSYLNLTQEMFLNCPPVFTAMELIKALLIKDVVCTENSAAAKEIFDKTRYGSLLGDGRVQLSLLESVYLCEKKRLVVFDARGRELSLEDLMKKASRLEHDFWTRYAVLRDFRNRGYIIKTALKFGADFRVYEKGIKPGEDHAKWVVFPVRESEKLTWQDFAAKNRVAHSTKKHLLLAIVDDEGDVSYWESRWLRP